MTDKDSQQKTPLIFSLARLRADCKMAAVRVDFNPPHLPASTAPSILPLLNRDRRPCTPAFLLPADQKYYQENLAFEEAQFEERIKRALQQGEGMQGSGREETLQMAAPSSLYCQICQEKFQDYFAHISSDLHTRRQTNTPASLLILNLCAALAAPPTPARSKPIRKHTRRQRSPAPRKLKKGKALEREDGSAKGQNLSTGLVEDSEIGVQK